MINLISYLVPFFGLIVCLFVVFTRKIDTKCSIRVSKMCLWMTIWTIVLFYDYPYDALKAVPIMVVRLCMLMVNILYVVEALRPKRKIKLCNKSAP